MTRPSHRLGPAIAMLVALIAAVGAASVSAAAGSARADDAAAVVKGGGRGVLTDPDGNEFPLKSFRVRGVVRHDGSARGGIHFRWRGSFPQVWGDPVCGGACDTIVLVGKVTSGSVASDGAVTLSGTAREIDKRRGKVVFDSGFDEPFSIVAGGSQGDDTFILQWCLLPEFEIEGAIGVEVGEGDDTEHGRREAGVTAASLSVASCSRKAASASP